MRGRAVAVAASAPRTSRSSSASETASGMRDPPPAPSTISGRPSAPRTIVGAIVVAGRLPGCSRFCAGLPDGPGVAAKLVMALFATMPTATRSAPKLRLFVAVSETAPPKASITTTCVVAASASATPSAGSAPRRSGSSPAFAASNARSGETSPARPSR
jgi:hypothetical protein